MLQKWKRGDVHPDTGLVFWCYEKRRRREVWFERTRYVAAREQVNAWRRDWQKRNNAKQVAKVKKWRIENREKWKASVRKWEAANPDKIRAYRKRSNRRRYENNILWRISNNISRRIREVLSDRGFSKNQRTLAIVGCSAQFLRSYIEARFQPGMTWDNYGKWEVDHAMPIATAKTKRQVEKLCHYTNLQPLWSADNRNKSDSVPTQTSLVL